MFSNIEIVFAILVTFFVLFGPGIICIIVGLVRLKKHPKMGKGLIIFGFVYLIIGLGICGNMMR